MEEMRTMNKTRTMEWLENHFFGFDTDWKLLYRGTNASIEGWRLDKMATEVTIIDYGSCIKYIVDMYYNTTDAKPYMTGSVCI